MRKILCLFAISSLALSTYAVDHEYKYRLTLTDKGISDYSIEYPEEFLSTKAIDRRAKHNIKINELDLPISIEYLDRIEDTGAIIVAKSKWNKSVAVHVKDSLMIDRFMTLPFVESVKLVWRGDPKVNTPDFDTYELYPIATKPNQDNFYGLAYDNIKILNGDFLHKEGFMGENMTIGIIDAGFNNYPKIEYLDNINILGYKNFVYDNNNLFKQKNEHGLNVISCIATYKPYRYVGTAPHANFWMLGTEDSESEYPIEEDYWAEAIEFADSVGVDIVNTSLGYTRFDAPIESHTREALDGKTALISRAASTAAKKGILLVISAGNAGNKEWRKVSAPADARGVLTVGAVARDSSLASFSSYGLTSDLRLKPDVVALGVGTVVIDDRGLVAFKSGTSFSSPSMCGIAACLWQAFPTLSNFELLDIIRESADRYDDPSVKYGYGIPDMKKAMRLAAIIADRKERLRKKK